MCPVSVWVRLAPWELPFWRNWQRFPRVRGQFGPIIVLQRFCSLLPTQYLCWCGVSNLGEVLEMGLPPTVWQKDYATTQPAMGLPLAPTVMGLPLYPDDGFAIRRFGDGFTAKAECWHRSCRRLASNGISLATVEKGLPPQLV